uniref:Uncharacterized protein n=1 Tax=Salix viminalis TaxID=40686 RepID=A0A6N2MAS1_SALVM
MTLLSTLWLKHHWMRQPGLPRLWQQILAADFKCQYFFMLQHTQQAGPRTRSGVSWATTGQISWEANGQGGTYRKFSRKILTMVQVMCLGQEESR